MKNNEPTVVHPKLSSGTYPSPAPQTQNQGQHERLPGRQGSQIGCGLIGIIITSTDFADKATVEKNISFGSVLCSCKCLRNRSVSNKLTPPDFYIL